MSTLFDDRAVRYMTDLIRDFQLEDYQAAGFPGNFGEESGGFTQVQEISPLGGGQGGLGDAQWTGSRRRDFEAWIARNASKGWDARTYEANYSQLFRDLEGPESGALVAVRRATDVNEAVEIVMERYERPAAATAHLDVRQDYARKALAAFRARGIDVAALKAQGRSGTPRDGEILHPLPIPAGGAHLDLGQLLAVLLPVLQKVLANPDLQKAIAPLLAPLLSQLLGVKPAPPAPPPPPPGSAVEKPSVQLSAAGLGITAILQALGIVGTPFGVGENPTLAGTLSTLIPIASAVLGMTGGWGALASGALKVLGPILSSAASAAQKK